MIYELELGQWNIPKLRMLLDGILPRNSFFEDFEVTHDFGNRGTRTLLLSARRIDKSQRILLSIDDITERLHLEESVRRSEVRYRGLFEAARDGIMILDPATRKITKANPFIMEFLGYASEELIGKELWEIGLLKDEAANREAFQTLKKKGFLRYEDLPLKTKSGQSREVEFVSNLYQEGNEEVIQCNIRDITERKQAEETLRQSEEQYRTLFDSIDEAFCVIEMIFDERKRPVDYRFLEVNPSFEKHTGMREVVKKRMRELSPHHEEYWFETYGKVALTGEPMRFIKEAKELGNRWFDVYAFRIAEKEGRKVGILFSDITERMRGEQARNLLAAQLADELAATRQLAETSTHLIRGGDIDALYQQILDAGIAIMHSDMASLQMFDEGESALELLAWRGFHPESAAFWKWVRMDAGSSCAEALRKAGRVIISDSETSDIMAGTPDLDEYRRSHIRAVQSTPLLSREGRLIGMISTHWRAPHQPAERELRLFDVLARQAADLIEREQGEEVLQLARAQLADRAGQLEQAVSERTKELMATNKQMEAFVYSIAHDLRAPLRSMQGFSTMLLEEAGAALNETGRDYANRISNSAEFMDAMLLNLLAFSRVSQQRIELTSVNLEKVLKTELTRLENEIQKKNACVEVVGPWPSVLAHEATLGQVLFNLINNALTFVQPDVSPLVRLRAEEGHDSLLPMVRVWVEDNGIGIQPEHQEQIFRLFTRLHRDRFPGTGFGLTIVQKGIERMGGQVGVESTPGHGSRFWIELKRPDNTSDFSSVPEHYEGK